MIIFTFHNLLVESIINHYFSFLAAVRTQVDSLFEEAEAAEGMATGENEWFSWLAVQFRTSTTLHIIN